MVLLKEDGSLDIERINKLPLEEYMYMMGDLTQEQVREYVTKLPINESKEPMKAVIAEDLINNLRKRRMRNSLK